jgi:hypothetical protein
MDLSDFQALIENMVQRIKKHYVAEAEVAAVVRKHEANNGKTKEDVEGAEKGASVGEAGPEYAVEKSGPKRRKVESPSPTGNVSTDSEGFAGDGYIGYIKRQAVDGDGVSDLAAGFLEELVNDANTHNFRSWVIRLTKLESVCQDAYVKFLVNEGFEEPEHFPWAAGWDED